MRSQQPSAPSSGPKKPSQQRSDYKEGKPLLPTADIRRWSLCEGRIAWLASGKVENSLETSLLGQSRYTLWSPVESVKLSAYMTLFIPLSLKTEKCSKFRWATNGDMLEVQVVPANGVIDSGANITIIGGDLLKGVAAVARLKKKGRTKSQGHMIRN